MEGVRDTISMEQIKQHYFTSHPSLNKFSIIPKGPDFLKLLDEPHDRDGSMQKKAHNGVH
jgi:glutathionyl-hydroquinone reductase